MDLSNNLISSIHNDSFGCFVALERLHLQLNNIDILFRWVFRGLAKLKVLNLSANSLRGLNAGMFSGLKVKFLFLSKCNIRQISSSAFNGSTHMKVIDLSWNKISMIPGSLFRHNPMLEVINLRGNRISQMEPAAFAFLAHLRSLDVQNNRFLCDCDIVPLQQWIIENTYTTVRHRRRRFVPRRYYVNCSNLRMPDLPRGRLPTVGVLDMTGNSVTTVGVESFRSSCGAFKVTRTLDLSNNLISSIHNDSFGCFVALERLHLQLNNIDILFRWVFRGLAKLKVLNLSANSLVQVPQQSIGGLRRIDLSHNKLASVHSAAFSDVPSLREIDLSNNNLQRISMIPGSLFRHNPMLEVINLRGNRISQMEPAAFAFLAHLPTRTLDLSNNLISSIHNDSFGCFVALERLHLQLNNIDILFRWVFRGLAKLKVLNLSANSLVEVPQHVHSAAFSDVPSLREIDLSNNNLQRVPYNRIAAFPTDWLRHLIHLEYVDYSGNRVLHSPFPVKAFRNNRNLTHVAFNQVDGIQRSLNAGMFSGLKVKFLFLSKCNIRQISSSAFNGSTHMKVIDLSWNKISMIPGSLFRHNPMLEVINLRGNRISQMEPAAFAFLAHLRSLDVQNNRFLCDCDIVPLQQWIIENTYTTARHRRRILFENATCFQQSSHAYLEMLRWDAGKQCWMKSTVVTGIAFASVLLVVCCVAFAYSSRFQALFWYEMVKAKISYRRKVPADAFGGNEYNAYISCVPDSNDEAWVVRHLLSAIENPPYELEPMKLCFPSRDFRPGRPKTASAASGIRSAERTLVILSAGYARCSWTRLELSMVSEMWRSGERSAESLVVVYLKRRGEDWVDVERLPVLGVRKNRWLIWPLEVADRPAFWMKLRRSLM
uniref:TIR domain-containing protein n=1 Tax=Ciona savignyi TaxID=51511 RepID=H2Y4T1_CIOSA